MTLCPVAIAVGCRKCPVFQVCPAKSVLGDQAPDDDARSSKKTANKSSRKRD